MKIAVTGGTGFVGRHLCRALAGHGHEVVVIARGKNTYSLEGVEGITFFSSELQEVPALAMALEGCQAVAHCTGINRETGSQTYQRVHVEGTRNILAAAKSAGVGRIVFTSYLRARPRCGSGYLESKWEAESLIRQSGLEYTVLRLGILYGPGDHMISHLHQAISRLPVFGLVGLRDIRMRPVAIDDVTRILLAALLDEVLLNRTVAVTGPEEITLQAAAQRVAAVLGKHPVYLPTPLWALYTLAWLCERLMTKPLVSLAQIRMLSEGISGSSMPCDPLPEKLNPHTILDKAQILAALPGVSG